MQKRLRAFGEWLWAFIKDYVPWTGMDQFLDSKWGKRFLTVVGGAIVTAVGTICSFLASLGPALKYGFAGAFLALILVAILILFSTEPANDKPTASVARTTTLSDVGIEMLITRASNNRKDLPLVHFTTQGRASAEILTDRKPQTLRFTIPIEQTVRESDLPVEVPIAKGMLIVKRFTDKGFAFEERNTVGDDVRAEIYFSEGANTAVVKSESVDGEVWDRLGRVQRKTFAHALMSVTRDAKFERSWDVPISALTKSDCHDLAVDFRDAIREAGLTAELVNDAFRTIELGLIVEGNRLDPVCQGLLKALTVIGLNYQFKPLSTNWLSLRIGRRSP